MNNSERNQSERNSEEHTTPKITLRQNESNRMPNAKNASLEIHENDPRIPNNGNPDDL